MNATRQTIKTGALALAGAALLGLAGCGNDKDQLMSLNTLKQVSAELKGSIGGSKAPAPSPQQQAAAQAQLAAAALRSLPGPVMLGTWEATGVTTVLGLQGQNGSKRSYATPDQQGVVMERGLMVATRGLGHDLQSANTGNSASLIRARRAGHSNRTHYYLDAIHQERPLPLSCDIASAGAVSAGGVSGTQMTETCTGGGVKITNSYIVSNGGRIMASRQWIGPNAGYMALQVLRD